MGHCLQARLRKSVSARSVASRCRFTCFNASENGGPSTDDDRKQEAYDSVRGWPFGAAEAIEATPASDITRGRLGDRWAVHAGGRRAALSEPICCDLTHAAL